MIEQNKVGHGVMQDGKPVGLWPVTLDFAWGTATRMQGVHPRSKFEVVPVYIGGSIPKPAPPPISPEPESA